jgi:hypothetical protein
MGTALGRLFFGLGVLLGVVAPQTAPELAARAWRSGAEVLVSAEVEGAFGETAIELARAGSRVALRVEARAGNSPWTAAVGHLRFDSSAGDWAVAIPGGDGSEKRVASLDAALTLATQAWALHAGPLAALERGGTVAVRASIGILDETDAWHDARILWGYAEPELRFAFSNPEEVPY